MTWKRFINRNCLQDGDYQKPPAWLSFGPMVSLADQAFFDTHPDQNPVDWYRKALKDWENDRKSFVSRITMIMGDLRRLEQDTVDENYICQIIRDRTSIDKDTIAAVLKEFMNY